MDRKKAEAQWVQTGTTNADGTGWCGFGVTSHGSYIVAWNTHAEGEWQPENPDDIPDVWLDSPNLEAGAFEYRPEGRAEAEDAWRTMAESYGWQVAN